MKQVPNKRKIIWVVEEYNVTTKQWVPTVGVGLSRGAARAEKRNYWECNYPSHQFRVEPYFALKAAS